MSHATFGSKGSGKNINVRNLSMKTKNATKSIKILSETDNGKKALDKFKEKLSILLIFTLKQIGIYINFFEDGVIINYRIDELLKKKGHDPTRISESRKKEIFDLAFNEYFLNEFIKAMEENGAKKDIDYIFEVDS